MCIRDRAEEAQAAGALIVGRLSPRSGVMEGRPTELVVDTDLLHVFDPESGAAVYGETLTTSGGAG